MAEQKDRWDKLEIIGKVALPVIIAGATLGFNWQVNQRQRDATMVEIAVGIVSEAPADDAPKNPLRDWAIGQLVQKGDLDQNAADQLRQAPLPTSQGLFDVQRMSLELSLRDSECRALHTADRLYREAISLKREARSRQDAQGVQLDITPTDIAQDEAALASVQAQLAARDCPAVSTEAFLSGIFDDPNTPLFIAPSEDTEDREDVDTGAIELLDLPD